jgi:phosphatidylethanolamine/phosphatidyl-N-methylethanolamine N-methyltransferase
MSSIKKFSSGGLFIWEFLKKPREIGSLTPSSRHLAEAVALAVSTLPKTDVLQIGAGTGVITKFLPKECLTVIEINESLATRLSNQCPELKIINECGVDRLSKIGTEFGCVITIPLINNPSAPDFIRRLQSLRRKKLLKWCVIYSYGSSSPLQEVDFEFCKASKLVWKNLPPARVWTYW